MRQTAYIAIRKGKIAAWCLANGAEEAKRKLTGEGVVFLLVGLQDDINLEYHIGSDVKFISVIPKHDATLPEGAFDD